MPSRTTLFLIICLIFLAIFTGWNYVAQPFKGQEVAVDASPTPVVEPTADAAQTTLLDGLSTQDKVAAVIAFPVTLSASPSARYQAELDWIGQYRPRAITIYGTRISQSQLEKFKQEVRAMYSTRETAQEPLLMVDHEGGRVQRLSGDGFSRLPEWGSLCSQSASQSAAIITTSLTELQAGGIDIILAPTVDVASASSGLRDRVCSDDPELVVERSLEFIEIAQNLGLKPVLKHFPGIGAASRDLHFAFDRVSITPADALLYKYILEQFPQIGVMVTPVGVTNQFPDIPCTLSYDCVRELSSNFPDALTITDGLDMAAARYNNGEALLSISEAAVRAARAGNNILVFGGGVNPDQMTEVFEALVAGYDSDPLVKQSIDTGAIKVLQLQGSAL